MKLETADDDDDRHGLDHYDRTQAIAGAVIDMAQKNPSFARRLEKFLDRMIVVAEDRELLGLPRGCFPTRDQYHEISRRDLENLQLEIAELDREIKALQAADGAA